MAARGVGWGLGVEGGSLGHQVQPGGRGSEKKHTYSECERVCVEVGGGGPHIRAKQVGFILQGGLAAPRVVVRDLMRNRRLEAVQSSECCNGSGDISVAVAVNC